MPFAAPSQRLPEPWTFFAERSLGGVVVATALRSAGEQVVVHDDEFAKNEDDVKWLAVVGERKWVVLSKDDRIRRNPVEREALNAAGVAAFFLSRSDLTGEQMAEAFRLALPAMKRALRRFEVPFIGRVLASGEVLMLEAAGERFETPKRIKG